jgi:acyl transferase domain-containing protein
LVEIGPQSALQGSLRDILSNVGRVNDFIYNSVLLRGQSATITLLDFAGSLWCSGYSVNAPAVNELDAAVQSRDMLTGPEMLVDLPPYPFNQTEKF